MPATFPRTLDLVTMGEPLIGIYPTKDSEEICRAELGGDASNVAFAAARLGLRVACATAVGTDPYGSRFLRSWAARGIDTSLVVEDPDRFTGLYVISFEGDGHRFAYYRAGSAASAYTPTPQTRSRIASAAVFHVSGISQAISRHMTELSFSLMEKARAAGALISYDVNYRSPLWSASLAGAVAARTIAHYADIVSANRNEVEQLGLADTSEAFLAKTTGHCRAVAVRDGAAGSTVRVDGTTVTVPACAVDVVDTVGAGDAFDAGFIAAVLAGRGAEETARFASAVAALTCTGTGSTSAQPTLQQAEQTMRRCNEGAANKAP